MIFGFSCVFAHACPGSSSICSILKHVGEAPEISLDGRAADKDRHNKASEQRQCESLSPRLAPQSIRFLAHSQKSVKTWETRSLLVTCGHYLYQAGSPPCCSPNCEPSHLKMNCLSWLGALLLTSESPLPWKASSIESGQTWVAKDEQISQHRYMHGEQRWKLVQCLWLFHCSW